MNRMYIYGFVVLCGLCASSDAQPEGEFAIAKKRATPSAAVLKDQIVDQLAVMLKEIPHLLRLIATIQEQGLQEIERYADGTKGCFWDVATKQQLASALQRVEKQVSTLEQLKQCLSGCLPLLVP